MVFSSLTFLQCFLPLCLLAYFLVPQKWRNGTLFLFSLLFYAWGEPVYVVLMLFSTALDYQHPTRHVSYNNGQYETESIYERKYLSGNDQYAVFLNSNQAQTVIEGSGKSGKLLLIKDSYGNTFSQFPVEDYAEVHVLDLRFFKGDVAEYAKENGITDTLVLYGTQNFAKDTSIKF